MNSPENRLRELLRNYVSPAALPYCVSVWEENPFHLKITARRYSKLGDYRYHPRQRTHRISINGSLNPHAFLVTYLHEVAHLRAFRQHGFRIAPHGREWKTCFRVLMAPVLRPDVFPEDVLLPLRHYMRKPKAASGSDPQLTMALQRYDAREDGTLPLQEVAPGRSFRFRQSVFVKEADRRTRALCRELHSGRQYLVSLAARVEVLEE
jgi:hypothetical protein